MNASSTLIILKILIEYGILIRDFFFLKLQPVDNPSRFCKKLLYLQKVYRLETYKVYFLLFLFTILKLNGKA